MLWARLRAAAGRGSGGTVTPNLKSLWLFNEGSGTATADRKGPNNGTLTSSALWSTNGVISNCIQGNSASYASLPTGANIFGLDAVDTEFGFFTWFFNAGLSADNTLLMLNKRNSPTPSSNTGLQVLVSSSGELNFTVEEGNADGYGGNLNGNWSTGLSVAAGWNLLVCNRTPSSASCVIRNSGGRTDNSLTGSFGGMQFNDTARGNRIGAYIPAAPFPLQTGNRVDNMGIYDGVIDTDLEDQIWNGGLGREDF